MHNADTAAALAAVADERRRLWESGFRPVPLYTWNYEGVEPKARGKRPRGDGWQTRARRDPPTAVTDLPEPCAMNTGILGDGLRPIDIDVDDPETVQQLLALMQKRLGWPAPVRHRANAARQLWLYRAAEDTPRKRILAGTRGKIEVLGFGQQFAAFGIHDTGAALCWTLAPGDIRADKLLAITEEQVTAFLAEAAPLIGADEPAADARRQQGDGVAADRERLSGAAPATPHRLPSREELKAVDVAALAAIVRQIKNDARFNGREHWVGFAHALAAAFPDDPDLAEELWFRFCEQRSQSVRKNGTPEPEGVWNTLQGPHENGADYLVKLAHQQGGIDTSAYRAAKAANECAANPLPEPGPSTSQAEAVKPELLVRAADRPATVYDLREMLARTDNLFDRGGVPVKLIRPADGGPPLARALTFNNVIAEAHRLCQPVKRGDRGEMVPITLPDAVAKMYLDLGEWKLRPLAGITTAPLLAADGTILDRRGYDPKTQLWCEPVSDLVIPERPSRTDAETALYLLRKAFRTFPFRGAPSVMEGGLRLVDLSKPPGQAESVFLVGLLTACCRASLSLAPGLLVSAPDISGSGCGKGLLVRGICIVAFGNPPRAFGRGHDKQELDKRIVADLIEGGSVLFLDNVNAAALRSETLAMVMTERPARVRPMGTSNMVPLNCASFVVVTGNGLTVSEDLGRRFLRVELDAECEDPEARKFPDGFLKDIFARRAELLTAALTIWRWGRQNENLLRHGLALGSFETWTERVRDPLLTLGCTDPVVLARASKSDDPRRRSAAELFAIWWECHGDAPVTVTQLHSRVQAIANPQNLPRQWLTTKIQNMSGTRAAGFALSREEAVGTWSAAKYVLSRTSEPDEGIGHRDYGGHRGFNGAARDPMPPMPPVPYAVPRRGVPVLGSFAAPPLPAAGATKAPASATTAVQRIYAPPTGYAPPVTPAKPG